MSVFLPPTSIVLLERWIMNSFLGVVEFSDHHSQRVAIGFNVLGDVSVCLKRLPILVIGMIFQFQHSDRLFYKLQLLAVGDALGVKLVLLTKIGLHVEQLSEQDRNHGYRSDLQPFVVVEDVAELLLGCRALLFD